MTASTLSKNRIQQNKKLNVKSPIQQRKRVPCVQINRCRSWWNQLRNLNVHLITNQSPHTVCTKWCIQRYKISLKPLFKKSSNFFGLSYKKPLLHKKQRPNCPSVVDHSETGQQWTECDEIDRVLYRQPITKNLFIAGQTDPQAWSL